MPTRLRSAAQAVVQRGRNLVSRVGNAIRGGRATGGAAGGRGGAKS